MSRGLESVRTLAVAAAAFLAQSAGAATLYDFDWSGGEAYSATGSVVLSGAVGVGDPFDAGDVVALDVELFDGAASVGTIGFADLQGGDILEGTRNASTLSITDIYLTAFAVSFGCNGPGCLFGLVQFHTPSTGSSNVDFGTAEAAQASFHFTEVPEPAADAALALALLTLRALRCARSRSRT
jgi:hypothetical protein